MPCVVDLAAMRSAMQRLGGDPKKINPLVPVDLVIDHSVQVDFFGRQRLDGPQRGHRIPAEPRALRIPPLGPEGLSRTSASCRRPSGIVHQVNLEYLAKGVFLGKDAAGPVAFPDTLVGTDSHTTMINGLGVLGWGVGGIEAEAVMLGQPLYMLAPEVIGFELSGELPAGHHGHRPGAHDHADPPQGRRGQQVRRVFRARPSSSMKVADRALVANMAPEYGATMGFFPIDEQTLGLPPPDRPQRRRGRTGRALRQGAATVLRAAERRRRDPALHQGAQARPGHDRAVVAGPKRPQDRVPLANVKQAFRQSLQAPVKQRGFGLAEQELARTATVADDGRSDDHRPRRRGHRRHHQLHQHQQPGRHARRRPAGQEGGRARAFASSPT